MRFIFVVVTLFVCLKLYEGYRFCRFATRNHRLYMVMITFLISLFNIYDYVINSRVLNIVKIQLFRKEDLLGTHYIFLYIYQQIHH